jgi:hypothetical protein
VSVGARQAPASERIEEPRKRHAPSSGDSTPLLKSGAEAAPGKSAKSNKQARTETTLRTASGSGAGTSAELRASSSHASTAGKKHGAVDGPDPRSPAPAEPSGAGSAPSGSRAGQAAGSAAAAVVERGRPQTGSTRHALNENKAYKKLVASLFSVSKVLKLSGLPHNDLEWVRKLENSRRRRFDDRKQPEHVKATEGHWDFVYILASDFHACSVWAQPVWAEVEGLSLSSSGKTYTSSATESSTPLLGPYVKSKMQIYKALFDHSANPLVDDREVRSDMRAYILAYKEDYEAEEER